VRRGSGKENECGGSRVAWAMFRIGGEDRGEVRRMGRRGGSNGEARKVGE